MLKHLTCASVVAVLGLAPAGAGLLVGGEAPCLVARGGAENRH